MTVGGAAPVGYPAWIATAVDPLGIEHASRLTWGFRNEVWRVRLPGDRDLAVTRFADARSAASIVTRTAGLQPRLHAVGVPSPAPVEAGAGAGSILITEFVDGTVGAALLDDAGGPALVGSILGAAWQRLGKVDPSGLDLDATWVRPDALAEASRARLGRVGPRFGRTASGRLAEAVAACADLLAGRRPAFVHGDLVPVNIVVRERRLAALVDFEFARLADPLLDAGWFDSVVAFHHPGDHPAAWEAFLAASEIDAGDPVTRDLLRILPTLRYLEILDAPPTIRADDRHWIAMLREQLGRA